MTQAWLKLKQAGTVLGVPPKDLQNFIQLGVLKPKKKAECYWFDPNLLLVLIVEMLDNLASLLEPDSPFGFLRNALLFASLK
jgi:hypothetical protein